MGLPAPPSPVSIMLVSDFYPPRLGGVENHIHALSSSLISLPSVSHCCVLTRHGSRVGHRRLRTGVDVYYLPTPELAAGTSLATFCVSYCYFRSVMKRHSVTVVHTHASTSALSMEVSMYCLALSIPCLHTEHSLFPLNDFATLNLSALQGVAMSSGEFAKVVGVSAVAGAGYRVRVQASEGDVGVIGNGEDLFVACIYTRIYTYILCLLHFTLHLFIKPIQNNQTITKTICLRIFDL